MSKIIRGAAGRACLGILLSLGLWGCSSHESSIDLAGEWSISYDGGARTATVTLPGSMTTNGLGDEPGLETPWTGQISRLVVLQISGVRSVPRSRKFQGAVLAPA